MPNKLYWRPALQKPGNDKSITALIATRDAETLEWNVSGNYIWRANIGWRHERKSTPPPTSDFVWLPHTELLATI